MEQTNKSVWMVEDGHYSDYHICGVFSTEEKAKLHVDELRKESTYNNPRYVEVILDEHEDKYCQLTWHVHIKTYDGSLHNIYKDKELRVKNDSYGHADDTYCSGVSTISEDHAMKVAVEARQAYLRKDI